MGSLSFWSVILTRFKRTGASLDVTHYVLSLGAQNATTGIYAKSFAAGATIQMVIAGRTSQDLIAGLGTFVQYDAVGVSDTSVSEGDEIKDDAANYYRVESVKKHYFGDKLDVVEAQLSHMPFHA